MLTAAGLGVFGSAPLVLFKTFLNKLEGHPLNPAKDKLGYYVDSWLNAQFGPGDRYIYGLCAIIFFCWILKGTFDFLNTYIASWLAQKLRMEAMERIMSKLLSLDQPFFDKQKVGDLVSRMVSD